MLTPKHLRVPRRARGSLKEGVGQCGPCSRENEEGQPHHDAALPAAFQ